MKFLRLLCLGLLSLSTLSPQLSAQKAVTRSTETATLDQIDHSLVIGPGKTLTLNGVLAGAPTGGTLNLGNVTVILGNITLSPSSVTWVSISKSGASLADLPTRLWSDLQSKPTTLAGAGITNGGNLDLWGAKTLPSGAVVGTTDTQTLTGKTISGASNTLTVRAGSDITGNLAVVNGGTGNILSTPPLLSLGDKAFKLDTYNSTLPTLTFLAFGDSLGDAKFQFLRGLAYQQNIVSGIFGDFNVFLTTSGGASQLTAQFSYWPTGIIYSLSATGHTVTAAAAYANGGSDNGYGIALPATCDTIKVYYVKESGAGNFKIQYHDGTQWKDASGFTNIATANATLDAGIATVSVPFGAYRARAVWVSGTVKLIHFGFYSSLNPGLVLAGICTPGLELNSANNSSQTILTTVLTDLHPDVGTLEMWESALNTPTFPADLATNATRFSTAWSKMAWIYFTTTPKSTLDAYVSSTITAQQCAAIRAQAATTGSWLEDNYADIGTYAALLALSWENDGTHPAGACQYYLWSKFRKNIGLDALISGVFHRTLSGERKDSSVTRDSVHFAANSGATIATSANLILSTTAYTLGVWVYLDHYPSSSFATKIFAGATNSPYLRIYSSGSWNTASQGVGDNTVCPMLVPLRRWTHLMASRDVSGALIYWLDGVPVYSATDSRNYSAQVSRFANDNATGNDDFWAREAFVMNREVTPLEAATIYWNGLDPYNFGAAQSSVASGSLAFNRLYEVRGTGTVTNGGTTYAVGDRFFPGGSTSYTTSGSPTVIRVGVVSAWQNVGGLAWYDAAGSLAHAAFVAQTSGMSSLPNASAVGSTFTLTSGASGTVAETRTTANSIIVPFLKTASGTISGLPYATAITPGTSFVMAGGTSDNSTYNYVIVERKP